jgi:D-alanine-D-alanine ligase
MVARRRTGSKIKILVLHNRAEQGAPRWPRAAPESESELARDEEDGNQAGAEPDAEPEAELAHLRALADGLTASGFDVALVDAEDDTQRITHAVVVEQPALVFLVDHFRGDVLRHPNVASLFELHGLTYTGSDALCLSTCRDRVRTHLLLSDAEIPVPGYAVVRDINAVPPTESLGAPVLVSHAFDDVYDDPDSRALAASRGEIEERARSLAAEIGLPLLVERFIEGRRIQAVVLGNRVLEVLPLSERVADASGRLGPAQIAQLDMDTADAVRALAQRAFRVMGCRDCAQVEFALDRDRRPHVIDVHPVFDMFPDSPFVVGARASELGFDGAVARLAEIALERAEPAAESNLEPIPLPEAEPAPEAPAVPEPVPAPEPTAPAARRPRPPTPRRQPASRGRLRTGLPVPKPPAPRAKKKAAKKKTTAKKPTKKKK